MVKSNKATKKFAKNHLANVIKQRKEGKEKRKLSERIENKQAKRKRSGTSINMAHNLRYNSFWLALSLRSHFRPSVALFHFPTSIF